MLSPVPAKAIAARHLVVEGRVQGVGFRPFVYRLAHELGLTGQVRNGAGRVEIDIEGPPAQLDRFAEALILQAPPLARPALVLNQPAAADGRERFVIVPSREIGEPDIHVPPDQFLCEDCRAEMRDPTARRYRYPFTNCTQCGPRYTLIRAMPYDRPNTSMADFPLCPDCEAEYLDPLDRRFHAQPLACPVCGPQVEWQQDDEVRVGDAALKACVRALRDGAVVAVRGVGGYHLLCDPCNDETVARLRQRKRRPHRPLAIMVPQRGEDGLAGVRALARPSRIQLDALVDPARPIVLVPLHSDAGLSPGIAPGLKEVGIMLPYSPLHDLLLEAFGGALVATSGNLSGEPVLTSAEEAERRLASVVDAFLHHDRPIVRPADDSVMREIAGRVRPLRLGRGIAPLECTLPAELDRPILATGGYFKNTVALGWGRRAVIWPHIGDLESPRSRELFQRCVQDLQALHGVEAEALVCDAHPDYPNSRWARAGHLPVIEVLHHHAHASAVYGEFALDHDLICFCWDGTGFGADGTIWGGELLVGRPGNWRRRGSLRPFRLPGGDAAARQGWRVALSLAWTDGHDWPDGEARATGLLREAWERGLNAPWCSSAGRLFDAAAALCGLVQESSFEAHAASWLEAACVDAARIWTPPLPIEPDAEGCLRLDWGPLIPLMMDERLTVSERADAFHAALARGIAEQAARIAAETGLDQVGLTGGVFQNRVLSALAVGELERRGLQVLLPERVPANDAGIAWGQLIEALWRSP